MVVLLRLVSVLIAVGALALGLVVSNQSRYAEARNDSPWLIGMGVAGLALLLFLWLGARDSGNAPRYEISPEERLRHTAQRVLGVLAVGFLLVALQLLRQQFIVADSLTNPTTPFYTADDKLVQDPRTTREQLQVRRGRIYDGAGNIVVGRDVLDYNGKVLPDDTVQAKTYVRRTYANADIAQLVGYSNPQYGRSGLEDEYNQYLSGNTGINPFFNLQEELLHRPVVGADLYLTIDPALQKAATSALNGRKGSIVLLDAKNGAVLAMAGYPRFDPAELRFDPSKDWDDERQRIAGVWSRLNKDPNAPLLLRPTQGLFTPGSTFKTVTLAAALDSGKTTPTATWKDEGFYLVQAPGENHRILDNNRPRPSQTQWTTSEGYQWSLNAVFAQMGIAVGKDTLVNYMQRMGFQNTLPFDLPTATSVPNTTKGFLNTQTAIADTGFGQGQLLTTPLQMALIAATFARTDGTMPKPFLVREIKGPQGETIMKRDFQPMGRPVTEKTGQQVHEIMVAGVQDGWASPAAIANTVSGGKTGTAEAPGTCVNTASTSHSWYIGWTTTKSGRTVAVAAIIECGGEGSRVALPAARQVLQAVVAQEK